MKPPSMISRKREMPVDQGKTLFRKSEEAYGSQYRAHFLDIYKRYMDSAEETTARRPAQERLKVRLLHTGLLRALRPLRAPETLPAMAADQGLRPEAQDSRWRR